MPVRPWRKLMAALSAMTLIGIAGCGNDDEAAGGDQFCEDVEAAAAQTAFDPAEPDYDFEVVAGLLRDTTPPEEIREEWEMNLRAVEMFADFDAEDPEAVDESEPLDFEELDAATRRMEAFILEECGVDITES